MSEKSIGSKILKSSFWTYLGGWGDKLIGFISTLVLARILLPDDFGIVATASIVSGLFSVITSLGANQYLIRKNELDNSDLNTAWTVGLIMTLIASIGIFISASPVAEFMDDDRLILVIQVLSISPFLSGFSNIGTILYAREYNYKPGMSLSLISRIIGLIIKVIIAKIYLNYWAFIVAEIAEVLIITIGSYVIHNYRPRFSLKKVKEQWGFSQWILLKGIFVYMRYRIDTIFISKILPAEALGLYSVSKDVATLPAGQVISPIMTPLYVGLSSVNQQPELFADKVHKTISVLFIILLPISFGTYVTADNIVTVLLGEKWVGAAPIIMVLAFNLLPGTFSDFLTKVMTAMGRVKLIFIFEVIFSLSTFLSFLLFVRGMDIVDIAMLRVSLIAINTFILLLVLSLLSSLSFFRIISIFAVPLIPTLFMVLVVMDINQYILLYSPGIQLCIQVASGAISYLVMVSAFIFLLSSRVKEYEFIWKTFYKPIFNKTGL